METNLKFNSAICTSREQSERLLALGLKKETADCVIMYYDGWHIGVAEDFDFDKDPVEPAWSLHRLIEILDIWYLELNFNEFNNAYEQVISYFEERVKGGFINKEYLEE
jgi:hypothetical protein